MSNKKSFKYVRRDPEGLQKRLENPEGRRPSNRDGFILSDYDKSFKVELNQDYQIRLCPPTWTNPGHYGVEIYVHYSVGNGNAYICNRRMVDAYYLNDSEQIDSYKDDMIDTTCPLCDERDAVYAQTNDMEDGDPEKEKLKKHAKSLYPSKKVICWIIDRDREAEGPILMYMAQTVDENFTRLALGNKRNQTKIFLDDPKEGRDIFFEYLAKDTGESNKRYGDYVGTAVDQSDSPLHNDAKTQQEWLDYVTENPIPECFQWYSYDHIKSVFEGVPVSESAEEVKPEKKVEKQSSSGNGEAVLESREDLADLEDSILEEMAGEFGLTPRRLKRLERDDLIDYLCDKLEIKSEDSGDAGDAGDAEEEKILDPTAKIAEMKRRVLRK